MQFVVYYKYDNMAKIKNITKYLVISLLLLLAAVILFACGKKEKPRYYTSAGNGSVIAQTINGKKTYKAVPNKWFEFVGWYNGLIKYSDNEVLTIKNSTPTKLEARFETSAKATFDRHLESFYNNYVDGESREGQFFNYSLSGNLNYTEGNNILDKNLSIYGYIDFENSSQFAFEVKEDNTTDFAVYYVDNAENANIYVQLEEDKYSFTDIGLITNLISSLPKSSEKSWNLDDLITDENTEYLINQYFGTKNSMGFINKVCNDENASTITISYHKILNLLKNIADKSNNASSLQKLIYALTCEYKFSSLPEMILEIKSNYQKDDNKEFLKDIEINLNLNSDYTMNFDGNKITLPKLDINLKINSFDYELSSQANSISNDVISSFPEPSFNMINVHADGELDFISKTTIEGEEVETIVDKYIIEIDADLNPFALVSFKKNRENNYNDIEWEKLGFLSFKVSLVPETDATALKAQNKRHNNVRDYINVLIDTKNNGANAYVFIGMYSPETLFTSSYLFNHSFHIPSLIAMLENQSKGEGEITDFSPNLMLDILMALVAGGIELENTSNPNQIIHDLLVDFLNLLDVDSEIADNNLIFTDNGLQLALAEVRTAIRKFEKDILFEAIGISSEIKLDKKLFGDDEVNNITHLAISMNKPTIDSVIKNTDNDYLNMSGEVIIDNFNNAHKVLVGINENGISELNPSLTVNELLALKGKEIVATEGVLSDGSKSTTFTNNKGKEKTLAMKIEDLQVIKTEGNKTKIRVILQLKDYPNSLSSIPMIGEEIYNLIGVPYGLVVYETYIELINE